MDSILAVARHFALGGKIANISPYGNGLINDTYLVKVQACPPRQVILQRLNRKAFPDPVRVMENLRAILDHVSNQTSRLRFPEIYTTMDCKDYWIDDNDDCWRAVSFIDYARTIEALESPSQACQVGLALGSFHMLVHDIPASAMGKSLREFHNTPLYLQRFDETVAAHPAIAESADMRFCLQVIADRRDRADILENAKTEGPLPLRIVHGDPKLDNFLFDESGDQVISLIDLDTVHSGLLAHDIGDCLRSCCNTVGESPESGQNVAFDLNLAGAILDGYFSEAHAILSKPEVDSFADAISLIPFELGLRFLTDHLQGNPYFRTTWPEQNLRRAVTQFRLAGEIDQCSDQVRHCLDNCVRRYGLSTHEAGSSHPAG